MSETRQEALQRLKRQIKNYDGYGETTTRPQADINIRLFLIAKIRDLLKQLGHNFSVTNPNDQERLESLINSTMRKLDTINQSLKTPTYIQEPFFHNGIIPEARLEKLYDLEDNMLEETDNIRQELTDLLEDEKDREAVEDHFLHIDAYVDNINQALFEREALILGYE